MKHIITVLVVLLLGTAVAFAGCTGSSGTSGPGQSSGPGSSASSNLVTAPTDTMPANTAVMVTVQEKVYDGTIPVVFNGGKGQALVHSIDVTLYRSDGQVVNEKVGTNKDDTVKLQGTKDPSNPDRVVVTVTMMNGQSYKVADVLSTYRQH